MRTETPPNVRLQDYQPFPFTIRQANLTFRLHPTAARVVSRLEIARIGDSSAPLRLDGEKLSLKAVRLNGRALGPNEYQLEPERLTIPTPEDDFVLEIETEISPQANTELSGLYMSGGRYCTQCEAEGFRRITFYPDRPDVLAPFFVRIEAEKASFPYLLSNGNPVKHEDLGGGLHAAEWQDPFPKPSYLFALVGGDFDVLEDMFTTRSGRPVRLLIYVEKGDRDRAAFAMQSLKNAMAWDEDVFGREYDLDVFQIVAVRDFNFGAMENKGLNIFNSAYVLADGETATDADFEAIESIVAHEYFHNWTGNRITCRDWFQLCLKEGLTVYRDQEFTKAMRSPAVTRIKEVIRLRGRQFAEDAGPLAHPVRPDAYARIDNLYTATVYEKGAELVRMLRLMIGDEAFFAGMNRYFDQHDGSAATVEDFVDSFRASAGINLDHFFRWYLQAGTPQVAADGRYDAASRTYRLNLAQTTAATPGQPDKQALPIPLRVALFGSNGSKLTTRLNGRVSDEHLLVLAAPTGEFLFEDVASAPVLSVNRTFSAPVRVADGLDEAAQTRLVGCDDDPFRRWDALQDMQRAILKLQAPDSSDVQAKTGRVVAALSEAIRSVASNDPAFAALLLHVPTVGELSQEMKDVDTDRIQAARLTFRRAIVDELNEILVPLAERVVSGPFDPSAGATGRRALRGAALSLLSSHGSRFEPVLLRAFETAPTMTESLAALAGLSAIESAGFDSALDRFESRWRASPLVMDKWFSVQASAVRSDIRDRLKRLMSRPDFDLRNPNRVRSLVAAFAMNNPVKFHAADGWGYEFLADVIVQVDPINTALSARLSTAFESWRLFDAPRRAHAEQQLNRLAGSGLSRNASDIIARALS
jgi:aminopeptidase N